MKPELLKKYSSSFADAYSIGCLEINNIFSSGAVEILSQKISREERAHRQRVFSFYINGNNVDLCDSLLSRIRLFKKNYDEICRTDSKVKRIFGISKLTDAYGDVLKCAAQTDFGEEWKAYIECLSNEFTGMAEEIDDFRHNLEYFSSFSLIVSRNHYSVSRGNCFGDDDNFSDQLEIINRTLFGEDASAPGVVSAIPESIQVPLEQLFPERISALHSQAETISEKIHCEIIDYAEALSFYSEISHFSIRARAKGVSVCLPEFSDDGSLVIRQGYDITLINKVPSITPNDVYLDNTSNSAFVIGENGGGKTTFLRMIAVNCILACAGCPTFCESAVISAPQKIVALFPEPENADSGNFDSDVRRINVALADCDSGNYYFFNEPFSGTTEEKGLVYTVNLAKKIAATSSRALIVTHFDKVTDYDFQIYSTFKSEDDPDAPEFVIKPYKRNDNSFAEVILKRYRLDKKSLGERAIQSVKMNEKPSI